MGPRRVDSGQAIPSRPVEALVVAVYRFMLPHDRTTTGPLNYTDSIRWLPIRVEENSAPEHNGQPQQMTVARTKDNKRGGQFNRLLDRGLSIFMFSQTRQ